MKRRNFILLMLATLMLSSCEKVIFSANQPIKTAGWHKDSIATFQWEITDTQIVDCDMLLFLRHTQSYPYQNIWLFLDYYYPFSDTCVRDTIEFYLADDRGVWLGNGFGNMKEMPVLLQSNFTPALGIYKISIQQAMRDTVLRGISDIGICIKQHQ